MSILLDYTVYNDEPTDGNTIQYYRIHLRQADKRTTDVHLMIQRLEQEWDDNKVINFFYIIDNRVVSICKLEIGEEYMTMFGVYTVPEHRSKSYCRQLIQECISEYADNIPFYLKVNKNNHRAIKIYKSMGFEYYSTQDDTYDWMQLTKQINNK